MSAPASKTHDVHIGTFNIACSRRDEADNPLHARLPALTAFIKEECSRANIGILCLQEVRATGELSAFDVAMAISKALGGWDFVNHKVDRRPNSFYRTTFWNPAKYYHEASRPIRLSAYDKPDIHSALVSDFKSPCSENEFRFSVFNVHAPVEPEARLLYWKLFEHEFSRYAEYDQLYVIAVGDMNKFKEDEAQYRPLFSGVTPETVSPCALVDHIKPDTKTFVSFPTDVDTDGQPFHSSLDAVITVASASVKNIGVCSTEVNRVSDHFLVHAVVEVQKF